MNMIKTGQKDPRFKNIERKVGIFVFFALAMLLALFFFMGKERGIFVKKYDLFLAADSGSGFIEGIPVKLLGFKIGKVKTMALTSEAKVRVALEIDRKYQKWIRKGSVAMMLKEGFIGDTVIEVTAGPSSGKVIEDKGELPFERTGGIEDFAREIKPVLQEIKGTISFVNNPEGDIRRSIANIEKLTEGLLATKDDLQEVLREAKGALKEATTVIAGLNNIGKKSMPVIDKTALVMDKTIAITSDAEKALKKLPEIIDKVDKVMNDVNRLSDAISNKSHGIKNMLEDTEDVLKDSKEILKGAKESWPIKSMLPPKKELKLIPLDSSGR
ncbi:MAG: MCE family protein [Nitrospirae bacterium]|nr:MCE family protein [Nitrospirota bacterium]